MIISPTNIILIKMRLFNLPKLSTFFLIFLAFAFSVSGMSGSGLVSNPYILQTCSDLWGLEINTSGYFELNSDIDCNNFVWNATGQDDIYNSFDGNDYTIKNLYINASASGSCQFSPIFNTLQMGAIFTDVNFFNITVEQCKTGSSNEGGLLFRTLGNGNVKISYLNFDTIKLFSPNTLTNLYPSYNGLITGVGGYNNYLNFSSANNIYMDAQDTSGFFMTKNQIFDKDFSFLTVTNSIINLRHDTLYGRSNCWGTNANNMVGCVSGRSLYASVGNDIYVNNCSILSNSVECGSVDYSVGTIFGQTYNSGLMERMYSINSFINCTGSPHCGSISGYCTGSTFSEVYYDNETNINNNVGFGGSTCPELGSRNKQALQEHENYNLTEWDIVNVYYFINDSAPPTFRFLCLYPNCTIPSCNITIDWSNIITDSFNYSLIDGTTYEFEGGLWGFNFVLNNRSSESINWINITLENSSNHLLYSHSDNNIYTVWLNSSLLKPASNNPFRLNLSMLYNLGICTTQTHLSFNVNDSITPICDDFENFNIAPSDVPYTLNWLVNCSDESLNHISVDCTNGYNFSSAISGENYTFDSSNIISSQITCNLNVKDEYNNLFYKQQLIGLSSEPSGATDLTPLSNTLTNIFLLLFWLVLLVLTLTLKGTNDQTIQFFNILQMITGFVAGSIWMTNYFLIGFPLILVSLGFFLGIIMKDR